ncbi:hypothetical protein N7463_001176 [Penicillium fimorum]|uniref:AMP-dependent synthetase/ligase domain-containing protein n=1 Tax=Penicillium fimorum TaxID=1882269 RepID=A0A9X0CCL2_9EURO|nr:hypothetical protein N7463_001176 [Penicillium fimorum]
MTHSKFQPRLLAHVLEQEAFQNPNRLFCIHSLSLKCIDHGWREVTVHDLNCAVNKFSSWIEKTISLKTAPTKLVYIGPNDIRYAICILACIKLGHCLIRRPKAMLLAPSTPHSTAGHLLQSGNCSILLFASEYHEKAQHIRKSQENIQAWEVMDLWKWFDGPKTPTTISSYCQEYTHAKEQETAVILYSSGTTGIPKEIPLPHGYFSALDYFQHLQIPEGRSSTTPWLSEPKYPHLVKTGLFHGSGLLAWAAALFHGTHFVIGPDIPLTAALLNQIVAETGIKTGLFVPDTLTYLSSSTEGLDAMAGLRCINFVGMPLPTNVGDKICQVTRLQSSIGMTEAGYFSTLRPHERKDWEYLEWNPYHPVEMRDNGCGYSELVIPCPAGRYTQCVFLVLPNGSEFCTGDLFIQHPRNPVLWKHAGRHDDVSKLKNRVLLYPCPIEKDLEGHNMVFRAVLTTDHDLRVVLIVDPDRKVMGVSCLPEDFVDNIWPLVEEINCSLPLEAQIARDHVLVASIEKPFQTTSKGSVRRHLVVESYSKEIESISVLS